MAKKTERPVIVCTEFRGVFFGYADDTAGDAIRLRGARMAIYWEPRKGSCNSPKPAPRRAARSAPAPTSKYEKSRPFSRSFLKP